MEPYICYVLPVYVGSISDVELTGTCGFLERKLKTNPSWLAEALWWRTW